MIAIPTGEDQEDPLIYGFRMAVYNVLKTIMSAIKAIGFAIWANAICNTTRKPAREKLCTT